MKLVGKCKPLLKSAIRRFSEAHQEKVKAENTTEENESNNQSDEYEEPRRKGWFSMALTLTGISTISLMGLQFGFGKADGFDKSVSEKRTLFVPVLYNAMLKVRDSFRYVYEIGIRPPVENFLPDEPPLHPMLLQKLLVLNFDGTLISKDFETGLGVVLHLRPDLMNFIHEMSRHYELVIFANEDHMFLQEAVMTLDPMSRYFRWIFGREFLNYKDQKFVKDLKFMNRKLSKVIVVDFDANNFSKESMDNLITVPNYQGEETDDTLVHLRRFLLHLAKKEIKDVRTEIKKYGGFNDSLDNFQKEHLKKIERYNKSKGFFLGKSSK